ncbi:MAG TPA: hypothetical protein VIG55_04220 [Methylosinus sp.]
MLRRRWLRWTLEPRIPRRILRLFASAAALLLLLASLGGAMAPAADALGLVDGPTVASVDCVDHGDGRGRASFAHCARCCILCDNVAQLPAARPPTEALPGLVAAEATRVERRADHAGGVDPRPPGWASSWSSQAPPALS